MDPASKSPEDRITALEDAEAIRRLKARYAIVADAVMSAPTPESAAAVADLFTEYGVGDFGPFGRFVGRAALLECFGTVLPSVLGWSRHYVTNPIVEVSGDRATGQWYFLVHAQAKKAPGGPIEVHFGTYEDTYVKTAAGWRYAALVTRFAAPPPVA